MRKRVLLLTVLLVSLALAAAGLAAPAGAAPNDPTVLLGPARSRAPSRA